MKRTVLYDLHAALNAKMTPFGGYEMPMRYEGIMKEHEAARTGAAVFDTCHMGEFLISGPSAAADLERILSRDVADMRAGTCRYGLLCNESGGVIDDLIAYRISSDEFALVVNAAGEESDFEWVKARLSADTSIENLSYKTAKIDVHGPKSPKIVASMMTFPIDGLKYFHFMNNFYGDPKTPPAFGSSKTANDNEVTVSRTGYTGEIGFEIYCRIDIAKDIWNDCANRGAIPAGLGARDTLRLEMGYPLYGHELTIDRNAAQSGLEHAISRNKPFTGAAAIFADGADRQLLRGIRLEGRRAARSGDIVKNVDGEAVGIITSGSFSPTLGYAIALAYIDKNSSTIDTCLTITNGSSEISGKICELPFYKNGTARGDIKSYL